MGSGFFGDKTFILQEDRDYRKGKNLVTVDNTNRPKRRIFPEGKNLFSYLDNKISSEFTEKFGRRSYFFKNIVIKVNKLKGFQFVTETGENENGSAIREFGPPGKHTCIKSKAQ